MVTIEIKTDTPAEMTELLNRMKVTEGHRNGREPVHTVQKEIHVCSCGADALPRVERLAGTSEKANEAEKITGKLSEDLRAHAKFIDGMPLPADMQSNLLLAARIIEIMCRNRELHQLCCDTEKEQICEARK